MSFIIDQEFSFNTNAELKKYKKDELIQSEGNYSQCFYYLVKGELSVFHFTEEGKEFLQHKVFDQSFFGEPAVLLGKPFPGNVVVTSECAEVYKINKDDFLNYLKQKPDLLIEFTKSIAEKSIRKSNSIKNIVFLNPENRIFSQLCDYKKQKSCGEEKILINITRKELSNMTGLRTETIIRTVKKMERDGKLEIRNGKIYF